MNKLKKCALVQQIETTPAYSIQGISGKISNLTASHEAVPVNPKSNVRLTHGNCERGYKVINKVPMVILNKL